MCYQHTADPHTRAIIRYGLETNDPWLADLVRRADAGETITDDNIRESETAPASHNDAGEEAFEALAGVLLCLNAIRSRTTARPEFHPFLNFRPTGLPRRLLD